MDDFNYNAPQYIDFTVEDQLELNEYGEDYFDMDHEVEVEYQEMKPKTEVQKEETEAENEVIEIYDSPNSTYHEQPTLLVGEVEENDFIHMPLRRSISAGNIVLTPHVKEMENAINMDTDLCRAFNSILLLSGKKKDKKILQGDVHILPSTSRLAEAAKENKPLTKKDRAASREGLNRTTTTQDKLKRKMSAETIQQQPNKYISLAEAVKKFQFGTPQRFRSQSHRTTYQLHPNVAKLQRPHNTIPHSPNLTTKNRSRPTMYLSHNEQEEQEAQEMKKNQIKAQPLNHKILRTPVLNVKVEKRSITKPQPFNFTEVKFQKKPVVEPEVYEFHARPAPKSNHPHPAIKPATLALPQGAALNLKIKKIPVRRTEYTPAVCETFNDNKVKVKNVELRYDGMAPGLATKPMKTKPEPFSFEERDKIIQKRKDEKIKKFMEEEKKKREFHARPIPSVIAKAKTRSSNSLASSKNDENSEPANANTTFKARPATVIHQKPFVPKKDESHLIEVSEFSLNTNRRAAEREEFEKKMKEKEEETEQQKIEYAKYMKKLEEERIAQLRKTTIHKANPIRKYKLTEIVPSTKPVTSPRSPAFSKTRRTIQN